MVKKWLVRRFVSTPERIGDTQVRRAYGLLEGWVSAALNLVICVVKLVPGVMIGSIALVADAVHSLGDVFSSGVVIWGFEASAKPSDREHPFGYGRVETVATLVIGIMLFVVAWEFAQNSVLRLMHPRPVTASAGLLVILTATVVVKEWLTRFASSLGMTIHSSTLEGDSWHHRSDVVATLVVIASLLAERFGLHFVDALGGLAVSGFIALAGYRITKDAVSPLVGEAPSAQLIAEIRESALGVDAVDGVHDVMVHSYGGLLITSLHIEVSSELDVTRAHDVAEAVESAVNARLGGWSVVHVDPINREHPLYAPLHAFLCEALARTEGADEFHDLRIVGTADPCYVIFDLKGDVAGRPGDTARLRESVVKQFPQVAKVIVNVEPRYIY
jgi:cation diffusion facilitator family transporter